MKLWESGHGVLLREVRLNRVYSVIPLRVVRDSPEWVALYLPPRSLSLWPHTREGATIRIPEDEWVLDGKPWEGGDILYLVRPGLGYTATGSWTGERVFDHWKIDLVEPVRRTSLGFDTMDQLLDVLVSADRSTWRWKDEDEVDLARERGIFTDRQVADLYQRGNQAIQAIMENTPPFDENWEQWEPHPTWRLPIEWPDGWDQV